MKEHIKNSSEEELLSRFRDDGELHWLGVLLERYTALLFGVSMKYLKNEAAAQDIVQQVFLKALGAIPKGDIVNIGAWLYRVTRNECITYLRSEKMYLSNPELSESMAAPEQVPHAQLEWDAQKEAALLKAIRELKEEQRICIELFFLKHQSYNDISRQTGFSLKQVKSNIQNGKRNLKNELAAFAPESPKKNNNV